MGETVHIGEEREALGNAVLVVPAPIVDGLIGLADAPIVLGRIELEEPSPLPLVIELETAPESAVSFSSKSVPVMLVLPLRRDKYSALSNVLRCQVVVQHLLESCQQTAAC